MKILIVDDAREITDYLKTEIEGLEPSYEVIIENSGYDALKYIFTGEIDLLLTDIAMPDMDGYQLFSRAKEVRENLPVIMMTGFGYDPNHVLVKARRDGLTDILYKPFPVDKLITLIRKRMEDVSRMTG